MAAGARVTVFAAEAIAEARRISVDQRIEIAEQAAADARATAPVQTGEYRAGIGVEVSGTTVRIVNNDPEAGYKEWGTSTSPPHFTMVNAARKYGRYSGMTSRGGR